MDQEILVVGNISDGFSFYGPAPGGQIAKHSGYMDDNWTICAIEPISDILPGNTIGTGDPILDAGTIEFLENLLELVYDREDILEDVVEMVQISNNIAEDKEAESHTDLLITDAQELLENLFKEVTG